MNHALKTLQKLLALYNNQKKKKKRFNYSIYLSIESEGRIKNNTQVFHRGFYMEKEPHFPGRHQKHLAHL